MESPVKYERRVVKTKELSQKIGPGECFVMRDEALFGRDTIVAVCNKNGKISVEKIKLRE